MSRPPCVPLLAETSYGLRPSLLPANNRKSGQFMCYETGQVY